MTSKKLLIIALILLTLFLSFFIYISKFPNGFSLDSIINIFYNKEKYSVPETIVQKKLVLEESTVIDTVEKVSPAVVSIIVKTLNYDYYSGPTLSEDGVGTGFIVDKNGLIVTNSHVVDNLGGDYSVVLKNGETYEVEKVHLDPISDLAILEITARDLTVVEFGNSDLLKVGQKAIAIGNALGRYQNTVTVGVVSGITRQLTAYSGFGESKIYENVIQTDAALNPGNSGGPLLNSSGQVIGINVATSFSADNISFAVPINDLKPILEGFIEKGKIVRPFLGITYIMISKEISVLRDLPEGAFISQVVPDTPAEEAGLQRGDIILKIDDQELTSDNSLAKVISRYKVDDQVNLLVDREGDQFTLKVILVEVPEN